MDYYDETMSRQQRMTRREARMARAGHRRRLALLTLGISIVMVLALVICGPWGPLKGLYSAQKASTAATRPRVAVASTPAAGKKKASAVATRVAPAAPAHVEKSSNVTPPAVAIVVDDTGNTAEKLPLWLQIDAPLTFAVMPYPPLSQTLAEEFYKAGYQIMMHIPTENEPPNSFSGKGQLAVGMSEATVFSTLDADIATVPHVGGVNNHQGGLGCNDLELMTYECRWAKQHGFFVVDSMSSVHPKVAQAAVSLGMPQKKNEVFIDHQNDPDYIRNAMRELAGLARKNGYAIGICHYHRPNTATVVGEMITALKAEGIHFAFARDIND